MTDDGAGVRLIRARDGYDASPGSGQGAPRGTSREAVKATQALGEFLDASLIRPLHFTEAQQEQRVSESIKSMTPAERVFLEIEMQARSAAVHTFDYDPLRD